MDSQCDYQRIYLYPNRVLLATMDERQRLARANEEGHTRIQEIRGIMIMQNGRIRELESDVTREQERTNALCERLHETNDRLTRIQRQV